MAKTVFIFGAGASKECGAPLMKEFLDKARDILTENRLNEEDIKEFETVFAALVELRGVFYKSGLDLDNIESVFSAFEIARLIGKLGSYTDHEIDVLDHAIKKVITRTIEETILFRITSSHTAYPPDVYRRFVRFLNKEVNDSIEPWSVMTFNYDCALDYAFFHDNCSINFCIDDKNQGGWPYLKLHGSLGWGICHECGAIKTLDVGPFIMPDSKFVGQDHPYKITSRLNNLGHDKPSCSGLFTPLIVPPTWNKGQHQDRIRRVWQKAANELGEAENIIVIGYSLPESDLFFRYLFALGAVGDAHIRRFWVINPDDSGLVEKRFRGLIGEGIRERFQYFPMTFIGGLEQMERSKGIFRV